MKNVISIFLLIYICSNCLGQKKLSDSQIPNIEGFFGKVKSLTVIDYNKPIMKFGEYKKGSLINKDIYKYDINGNLIKKAYYDYKDFVFKEIYKYDRNGNLIEKADYKSDGSLKNSSVPKCIYKYNESGNQIEYAGYDFINFLKEKQIYKYDRNGNLIEIAFYDAKGNLTHQITCKYDGNGNAIYYREDDYQSGTHLSSTATYDVYNNPKKGVLYLKGDLHMKYHYEYVYDSKGNFTKITQFRKRKNTASPIPFYITEREIEYYD